MEARRIKTKFKGSKAKSKTIQYKPNLKALGLDIKPTFYRNKQGNNYWRYFAYDRAQQQVRTREVCVVAPVKYARHFA